MQEQFGGFILDFAYTSEMGVNPVDYKKHDDEIDGRVNTPNYGVDEEEFSGAWLHLILEVRK